MLLNSTAKSTNKTKKLDFSKNFTDKQYPGVGCYLETYSRTGQPFLKMYSLVIKRSKLVFHILFLMYFFVEWFFI